MYPLTGVEVDPADSPRGYRRVLRLATYGNGASCDYSGLDAVTLYRHSIGMRRIARDVPCSYVASSGVLAGSITPGIVQHRPDAYYPLQGHPSRPSRPSRPVLAAAKGRGTLLPGL